MVQLEDNNANQGYDYGNWHSEDDHEGGRGGAGSGGSAMRRAGGSLVMAGGAMAKAGELIQEAGKNASGSQSRNKRRLRVWMLSWSSCPPLDGSCEQT